MSVIKHPKIKTLHLVAHPLVAHKLSVLRDKNTSSPLFKQVTNELSLLLIYEATKNFPLKDIEVTTPLETMTGKTLDAAPPVVVPILRAGLGMVDSFLSLMPQARVGHIGLYRDEESLQPQEYYYKIPENSQDCFYFLCDPMLATGGSVIAAINELKKSGIKKIIFICIVSAPEGAEKLYETHPDIPIYTAVLDRQLNENSYILPGLGDAGDRLFGTK